MIFFTKEQRLIFVFLMGCSTVFFLACSQFEKNKTHQHVPDSEIEQGKTLANKYCQSCHLLPSPSLLNSSSWEKGVLPAMGPRLGIFKFNFQNYPSYKNDPLLDSGFYPSKPQLTNDEWHSIISYYTTLSPDSLPAQQPPTKLQPTLPQFQVLVPAETYRSAATCMVKINEADSIRRITLFDLAKQELLFYNEHLKQTEQHKLDASIVDMITTDNGWLACNMGMVNPNNGSYGKAQFVKENKDEMVLDSMPLFDSLARPVQLTACDLNNDKKTDYLVCEFGNMKGALSWMENDGSNHFTRHVLLGLPGAIKAYANDYNGDGLLDIWALFAQGEEGVFLFTNKGNGIFNQQQVLRFPPVYGSTYFELADCNKDGYLDIIYTCGDNADYSMVLKPYHGVYIYLNDGNNRFEQKYFYPINGCFKAMASDFDKDGDLDIATIAFFADYATQPQEGFVYLENKGELNFNPHSTTATTVGRWLTMDIGDIDKDGWTDIVLGNFSVRPSFIKPSVNWEKGPPFMVLKNLGRKK